MGKSHGLIITLILFIIATLALGVTEYYMAKGYQEAVVKLAEAETKVKESQEGFEKSKGDFDRIRVKVGYPLLDADKIVAGMTADIAAAAGRNVKPANTFTDALKVMGQTIASRNDQIAQLKKKNDDYRVLAEAEIKKSRAQKSSYDDQRKKAEVAFVAQVEKDTKSLKEKEADFQKQVKKVDRIELEAKKLNEQYRTEAVTAEGEAAVTASINTSLSVKLDELKNADFTAPDGLVLFVDQVDRTVHLNIGKKEGLRVLTNFGVFPYDTLEQGRRVRKGTVEVTKILGDHEALARIVSDSNEDPVMPGDMIYTSLWKAGQKTLYALTYNMDIDGDGKSDLEVLKNLIDASGAEVALWVDEEGMPHGQLSPEVNMIVTSNKPMVDVLVAADPATRERIMTEHQNLLKNAQRNNIREVKLAELLRKIHYKPEPQMDRSETIMEEIKVPLGDLSPKISDQPAAPVYVPNNIPDSRGPKTHIFDKSKDSANKAAAPSGSSSDYYFRKRTP
ncbi:MAG: hypothetical protein Q4G59_02990 [Planctomycetia bacterium]|nr:hypothetical protein [Planctomycetia bacterium]